MKKDRNRTDKRNYIPASVVGQVKYCPKAVALKYQGVQQSTAAKRRMKQGDQQHNQFNEQVARQQRYNKSYKTGTYKDNRCYVATHLYGQHDPITIHLREVRDNQLLPHWWGRLFTRCYYALSPLLVSLAKAFPFIDKGLEKGIDLFIKIHNR